MPFNNLLLLVACLVLPVFVAASGPAGDGAATLAGAVQAWDSVPLQASNCSPLCLPPHCWDNSLDALSMRCLSSARYPVR